MYFVKCLFILYLIIALAITFLATSPLCDIVNTDRFDCFPEYGANEKDCGHRGCCWSPPNKKRTSNEVDEPYCFYPSDFPSYQVVDENRVSNKNGYTYSLMKNSSSFRPNEILKLEAKIIFETDQRLRVQISDPNSYRYEVPIIPDNDKKEFKHQTDSPDYQIYVTERPFSLKVFRKSSGRTLFDTSVGPLVFADQYIEFSTMLPNKFFFGLGEHRDSFSHQATWKRFTNWNR